MSSPKVRVFAYIVPDTKPLPKLMITKASKTFRTVLCTFDTHHKTISLQCNLP